MSLGSRSPSTHNGRRVDAVTCSRFKILLWPEGKAEGEWGTMQSGQWQELSRWESHVYGIMEQRVKTWKKTYQGWEKIRGFYTTSVHHVTWRGTKILFVLLNPCENTTWTYYFFFFSYLLVFLRNKERHELGNKYNEIINTTLQNTIIARLNRTALQESARIQCRFNMAFPAPLYFYSSKMREKNEARRCQTSQRVTPAFRRHLWRGKIPPSI